MICRPRFSTLPFPAAESFLQRRLLACRRTRTRRVEQGAARRDERALRCGDGTGIPSRPGMPRISLRRVLWCPQRVGRAGMAAWTIASRAAAGGLGRVLTNAQIAAPLLWAINIGCPKNCTHCYRQSRCTIQTRGHSCADPRPSSRWDRALLLSDCF